MVYFITKINAFLRVHLFGMVHVFIRDYLPQMVHLFQISIVNHHLLPIINFNIPLILSLIVILNCIIKSSLHALSHLYFHLPYHLNKPCLHILYFVSSSDYTRHYANHNNVTIITID